MYVLSSLYFEAQNQVIFYGHDWVISATFFALASIFSYIQNQCCQLSTFLSYFAKGEFDTSVMSDYPKMQEFSPKKMSNQSNWQHWITSIFRSNYGEAVKTLYDNEFVFLWEFHDDIVHNEHFYVLNVAELRRDSCTDHRAKKFFVFQCAKRV